MNGPAQYLILSLKFYCKNLLTIWKGSRLCLSVLLDDHVAPLSFHGFLLDKSPVEKLNGKLWQAASDESILSRTQPPPHCTSGMRDKVGLKRTFGKLITYLCNDRWYPTSSSCSDHHNDVVILIDHYRR